LDLAVYRPSEGGKNPLKSTTVVRANAPFILYTHKIESNRTREEEGKEDGTHHTIHKAPIGHNFVWARGEK
jgi:hypothetical protein